DALFARFRYIRDHMVIVDAGSGTGLVAQSIAERCHKLGVNPQVIALDVSHEYYDTSSEHPVIELAFGDAAEQIFPANSVDIKYYATSGHEIASFGGGVNRMNEAVKHSFQELKPGGQLIVRDFVK